MPTRTAYRHQLAPLLGEFETGTADAGASAAVLTCTTALASGARVRSSVLPASLFQGKFLHRPDAALAGDRDRLVATYDPVAGVLYPDEPWTNSPGGEAFEILGLFSGADLNALVDEALARMYVAHEVALSPAAGTNVRRHNLTADLPALTNPAWVYQVGHLEATEHRDGTLTLPYTDPFRRRQRGEAVLREGEVWLEGPSWTATQVPYVLAVLPAARLCRATSGGVFGEQTGLDSEVAEAPVDARWLAWVAVVAAMDRIDHLERTGAATQEALRSRQMAAARVTALTAENYVEPDRTLRPRPTYIGPTLGRVGARRGRRW